MILTTTYTLVPYQTRIAARYDEYITTLAKTIVSKLKQLADKPVYLDMKHEHVPWRYNPKGAMLLTYKPTTTLFSGIRKYMGDNFINASCLRSSLTFVPDRLSKKPFTFPTIVLIQKGSCFAVGAQFNPDERSIFVSITVTDPFQDRELAALIPMIRGAIAHEVRHAKQSKEEFRNYGGSELSRKMANNEIPTLEDCRNYFFDKSELETFPEQIYKESRALRFRGIRQPSSERVGFHLSMIEGLLDIVDCSAEEKAKFLHELKQRWEAEIERRFPESRTLGDDKEVIDFYTNPKVLDRFFHRLEDSLRRKSPMGNLDPAFVSEGITNAIKELPTVEVTTCQRKHWKLSRMLQEIIL